jgi:hypothetical protein
MGILDEAIREHLELKRQHGADDSELKQLEDEAFGPPGRPGDEEAAPDSFAEAPTEFMAAPETGGGAVEASDRRERSDIAALQEPPPPPESADEEQPAMEHEVVPGGPESSGPSTEEREVIADQPTEMYDVEAEIADEDLGPSDEQLVEEEMSEPRLAPVDPLAGFDEGEEVEASAPPAPPEEGAEAAEEEDDFWDEQRLSDELSQALEAPAEEPEAIEVEEEEIVEEIEVGEEPEGEEEPERVSGNDEDILEDTPDFLEDSEDDQLWFEQKPPKDFDFDD